MAYAPFDNNKIQMGREATAGTAATASTIWRGPFAYPTDERTRTVVEEQIGTLVQAERIYDSMYLARLSVPETELTFEQFPHLLEMGIGTDAAPVDNTTNYTYEYAFPYDGSVNTVKHYTLKVGNTVATDDITRMVHCFAEEINVNGRYGEAWKMSGTIVGREMESVTTFDSDTLPTVNDAIFANTSIYIDDSGGTIGTTQVSGVLMGFNTRIRTGLQYVPVGDGNLYYSAVKWTKPQVTFTMTLELEDSSLVATERAKYSSTPPAIRLIRLDTTGPTANQALQLNMAAKYTLFNPYSNENGNTTVDIEGEVVYSSTDSLFWECNVTNELSALPG